MIRTRAEIMDLINTNPHLLSIYQSWKLEQQAEFLDFCSGARGVKMLYDVFFKEIFNAEYAPERLIDFLNVLLDLNIRSVTVLPTDSTRLADETSLVIADIVAELDDGRLTNIEVQKIGYEFPGPRSSWYSADLLLRQYKRARSTMKKEFTYKALRPVYTIVIYEKSPREFRAFPNTYVHHFRMVSDSGITLELLQNIVYVPIDIFLRKLHDKGVGNDLDAWFAFLGSDDPQVIAGLLQHYPKFRPIYEQIYTHCLNMEDIMFQFSEELRILDRNTAHYMIDELEDRNKDLLREKEELASEIADLSSENASLHSENADLHSEKADLSRRLEEMTARVAELETAKV